MHRHYSYSNSPPPLHSQSKQHPHPNKHSHTYTHIKTITSPTYIKHTHTHARTHARTHTHTHTHTSYPFFNIIPSQSILITVLIPSACNHSNHHINIIITIPIDYNINIRHYRPAELIWQWDKNKNKVFVKLPACYGYSEPMTRGKSLKANIKRVRRIIENLMGSSFDRDLVQLRKLELS